MNSEFEIVIFERVMELNHRIGKTAEFLQRILPGACPETAAVLGSGLGALGDELDDSIVVELSEIPNWPVPTVSGHKGRMVFGRVGQVSILALQGRVHFYEGYSIQEVTFPVRVMGKLGVKNLILTNAAGGLNPEFRPGDLMLITDHINFMFTIPLIGPHDPSQGVRFPDMSRPYDPEYLDVAEKAGRDLGIPLRKGVLIAVTGPSYETAAEVRMLRSLGADAVCMSTVPEVIVGVQMGIRILGISCITNLGTGLSTGKLTHDEVEKTARWMGEKFVALVKEFVIRISRV